MSVIARRKLLEAANALAKTNRPTVTHYRNLLDAVEEVWAEDAGFKCKCLITTAVANGDANPEKGGEAQ